MTRREMTTISVSDAITRLSEGEKLTVICTLCPGFGCDGESAQLGRDGDDDLYHSGNHNEIPSDIILTLTDLPPVHLLPTDEVGRIHGVAVATFPNGRRIETPYEHGEIHGVAVETFPNGARIEMPYEHGEIHGVEVETFPDGRRREVPWERGRIK